MPRLGSLVRPCLPATVLLGEAETAAAPEALGRMTPNESLALRAVPSAQTPTAGLGPHVPATPRRVNAPKVSQTTPLTTPLGPRSGGSFSLLDAGADA